MFFEDTTPTRLADQMMDPGTGALYAVVSILMVFLILLIIIGVTNLLFKATGLWALKKELEDSKKAVATPAPQAVAQVSRGPVVITDEDMMAAVLVATIDYQQEIKKDVRVVSIKEVK